MKKLIFAFVSAIVLTACGGKGGEAPAAVAQTDADEATPTTLNIRFINEDSVTANYNLAKDFQELSLKAYSELDAAQRAKAAELQRYGAQIEEKVRSNGYLSEASYNADVQKFNKMQQDAQAALAQKQSKAEQEMIQRQTILNDSIQNFIKEYNAEKGYDAILFKAAGVYFNPALDITDEVIKGLNARYNKK